MSLSTYLFFDGNCREAFEFYRSVFGGDLAVSSTFADGPPEIKFSEEEKDRPMHVSLPVGSSVLMGSDTSSSMGPPLVQGSNFSVSVDTQSKEHADEVFTKLSEGGEAKMAMQDTFWGAYFGVCTDRFGVGWMVSFHEPDRLNRRSRSRPRRRE